MKPDPQRPDPLPVTDRRVADRRHVADERFVSSRSRRSALATVTDVLRDEPALRHLTTAERDRVGTNIVRGMAERGIPV